MQLTEAGKVFHKEAQTLLRAYAVAVDRTREAGNMTGGTVRIGYLKNAARPVIIRFVRFMNHEHPDIPLELTCMDYGELRRAIEDGTVDVALGINVHPRISRNYRSTPIYTDHFFAIMGKDHPLATHADGISMAEIVKEKLLLPDTFAYAGLSELVDKLVDPRNQEGSHEYYSDIDTLYLKVQTEHYVAFSSGLNNSIFGNQLAIIPILGIDSSFKVSAFYNDDFVGDTFVACRKGFESCQKAMETFKDSSDGPKTFSLADFG